MTSQVVLTSILSEEEAFGGAGRAHKDTRGFDFTDHSLSNPTGAANKALSCEQDAVCATELCDATVLLSAAV